MKKMLLTAALATSATMLFGQCTELFISEYVEGWGNNKALELYNPTANPINLSSYRLERYSNGSSSADVNQRYPLPNVNIEPYSAWVIVIDKRVPDGTGQEQPVWTELQAKADHFANPVYEANNTMYFNGNDAMVLRNMNFGNDGIPVDVFGRIAEDPGQPSLGGGWNNIPPSFTWVVNQSEAWSTDHSLIRKPGVTIGNFTNLTATWNVGVEWDSLPPVITGSAGFLVGNWETLGWHACECNPLSVRQSEKNVGQLYPNPVSKNALLQFVASHATQRYEVYDLSGKMLISEVVPGVEQFEVSTRGLDKGIYLLRTFSNDSVFAHKFIVQ